jgi:hypothetical protein
MKLRSERGQAVLAVALLLGLIVLAVYAGLMAANQRQMKADADAIGNMAGDAIDEAARQKQDDTDWQIAKGTVASFWVNNQRIPTNDHAIAPHGAFFLPGEQAGVGTIAENLSISRHRGLGDLDLRQTSFVIFRTDVLKSNNCCPRNRSCRQIWQETAEPL